MPRASDCTRERKPARWSAAIAAVCASPTTFGTVTWRSRVVDVVEVVDDDDPGDEESGDGDVVVGTAEVDGSAVGTVTSVVARA